MKDSLVSYIDCYYEPFKHFPINYDIGPFLILFNKNIRAFAKDNGYKYKKTFYIYNLVAAVRYFLLCIWQGALYVLNKKRKENVFSMLLRRWKWARVYNYSGFNRIKVLFFLPKRARCKIAREKIAPVGSKKDLAGAFIWVRFLCEEKYKNAGPV